ncbi:MAG TPA: hypothetical protein VFP38_23080, partial [Bradyrhizobium sp.]|nr:hypothetical protein [Bradyrhizobium sp.]
MLQNHIREARAPQAATSRRVAAEMPARFRDHVGGPAGAIVPPGGVRVAFGATLVSGEKLAFVSAKPPACIRATPRSQRDKRFVCR